MKVADFIFSLKPYEGGKPIDELKRELNLEHVIKLASNENPIGPSERVVNTIKNTAKDVSLYPDGNAYYLKNILSEKLNVYKSNILFGNGSDEIIELIYRTFATSSDDEILYCFPTFVEYKIIGAAFNKKIVELPLRNYSYDADALIKAINKNTRLIFLNIPNNPTGTIMQYDDVKKIIDASSDNTLIVIDEAYYEYAKSNSDYPDFLKLYKLPNVVILRTFSKAYALAGLRIGYAVANSEIIGYLNRTRPPFNVNIIAQAAAITALKDDEHLKETIEINESGKKYIYGEFDKMGIRYVKSYANFILFDTSTDADIVYKEMLNNGVIIRSMTGYGYKTFLRVTVGTMQENRIFIETLKKVLNV